MWLGNSREGLCYAIFPGYNVRDNLEIPGNGLCFKLFPGYHVRDNLEIPGRCSKSLECPL